MDDLKLIMIKKNSSTRSPAFQFYVKDRLTEWVLNDGIKQR